MAASNFFVYNKAIARIGKGIINLTSSNIYAALLHSGYTPSTASHSTLGQINPHTSTATGTPVAHLLLASKTCANSGAVATKFDSADINGFSLGGNVFKAKYLALYAASASDGTVDNPLLGFLDLDTASTTGVEVAQLNITIPSGGWFKFNTN